jgi:hypothetical protein
MIRGILTLSVLVISLYKLSLAWVCINVLFETANEHLHSLVCLHVMVLN